MKEEVNLYRILRPVIAGIYKILFWPRVYGKENIPKDKGVVLAGTHIGYLDPGNMMIATKRNVYFLAKHELHKSFFGFFFKAMGTIPVDRSRHNPDALAKAVETLKAGKIIGIFPEGTRNLTNDLLLPFKFGAVSMAQKANVSIVPFAIVGKYRLFSRIKVRYGTPIDISGMNLEDANKLLMEEVIKLIKASKKVK